MNSDLKRALAILDSAASDQELQVAREMLSAAAKSGDPQARRLMGALSYRANQVSEALFWYELGHEAGDPLAAYCLGLIHLDHNGAGYQPTRAAEYFEGSASSGCERAAVALAELLILAEIDEEESAIGQEDNSAATRMEKAAVLLRGTSTENISGIAASHLSNCAKDGVLGFAKDAELSKLWAHYAELADEESVIDADLDRLRGCRHDSAMWLALFDREVY